MFIFEFLPNRLENVYDLNAKTYVLKLKKDNERSMLLIESGIRFHTTNTKKDINKIPSGFAMKLRKHIKGKKLEDVKQVGVERVVLFQFGSGENRFYLICEFYAGGNIILTDSGYKILQLIRTHSFNEEAKTAMYKVYPFEQAASMCLEKYEVSEEQINSTMSSMETEGKGAKKVRELIFKIVPYCHNSIIDIYVKKHGLNSNSKITGIDLNKIEKVNFKDLMGLNDFCYF